MKTFFIAMFIGLALGGLSPAPAGAATFSDDFSGGINSNLWQLIETTAGIYSVDDTNGDVRFAKVGTNPGGLQNIGLRLNLAALTADGMIHGDFYARVEFSNAVISGGGLNQVELHSHYDNGGIFYDVRDGSNVHIWTGAYHNGFATTAASGAFAIERVGALISGYFEGDLIWQTTSIDSPLNQINFVLQNNLGSNDATSVIFDNFSLTSAEVSNVPLPAAAYLLGAGLLGLVGIREKLKR